MNKLLLTIILLLVMVGQVWGASYYGCASAAINADNTFCTTATGSCAGDTPVNAATALAGTHSLFANGCTISIPNTSSQTFTAAKISNKDDGGAMVDGGQFTYTTAADYTVVLQASIETGGTTGAALAISGSGNPEALGDVFVIGSSGTPVTITGGSASNMFGVNDQHTGANARVTVYAAINGGTHATAYGYYALTTGPIAVTGNATGGANGNAGLYYNNTASVGTIAGDCIAGTGGYAAGGCVAAGTGYLTVTGNSVGSARTQGFIGSIKWVPSADSKYFKQTYDGSNYYYYSQAPPKDKVLTTDYTVDYTDGSYDQGEAASGSGGGGAWGF